jgi:meso-butanediol dehydrogenase / (S,S)-butanediol dehydrogenase / diacetyl reductase
MRLAGKFAIVTGGGSGIGAATARLFAAEGAAVAIFDRDLAQAEGQVNCMRQSGATAFAWECDVSETDQVRRAVDEAVGKFGSPHVLFNNAGIAIRRAVADAETQDWDRVMETNVRGAFLCSKFCVPRFAPEGGSIIHAASVTGITGVRSRAAYSAAKGALVALTRNMALDYAHRNIRVNCVCPGFVRTPMIQPLLDDPERGARLIQMHPLGRLGEPEDVAKAVLFLACGDSAWITGISLIVDGGFSAGKTDEI